MFHVMSDGGAMEMSSIVIPQCAPITLTSSVVMSTNHLDKCKSICRTTTTTTITNEPIQQKHQWNQRWISTIIYFDSNIRRYLI